MESVKICHFKKFRVGIRNFALRTFCCFFLHYIHVKSLFCEVISAEYEFNSVKFKGVSIDLEMNNLDLRGNTTEFKTLYIDLYIRDGICQNLSFLKHFCMVRIFARETLLLFRCFNIHVKMCILLSYCARE